ncbi:MAG: MurT ligase domain-containing protein, partial [Acidimicrobiales bacterium]
MRAEPERTAIRLPGRARAAARATGVVGTLSRRLHLGSGSFIGGRVGLLLDPELLARLGRGRAVALVTGTNGKTTTTRLLAAALGGPLTVATSAAGSNLPGGLVAALAGAPLGVPAVLEVDEGYLGQAVTALAPKVVAVLNLSRDQLDRVSEVRMVAERFRVALAGLEDTTVVANADDPLVAWAAGTAVRVVWVAAGQLWWSDAAACPACNGPITFGSPAQGWSSECGLRRPEPSLWLADDELVTADGRRLPLHLALPGRCNRSNAAMATAAAKVLGVDELAALTAMSTVRDVEGRFAVVHHGGVTARLLLAKNPAGWAELLDLLDEGSDPVVVGINARIADGHDPSWLWDVAFERLAGRQVVAT